MESLTSWTWWEESRSEASVEVDKYSFLKNVNQEKGR